jgi:hypothetical protein
MAKIDIQVPDIGDFDEVNVMALMVKELKVKVGDKVKQATRVLVREGEGGAAAPAQSI